MSFFRVPTSNHRKKSYTPPLGVLQIPKPISYSQSMSSNFFPPKLGGRTLKNPPADIFRWRGAINAPKAKEDSTHTATLAVLLNLLQQEEN